MFIIVPLSVITAALVALVIIVGRKWPYLRKLEPEAHTLGRSFFHDLAPEAAEHMGVIHWKRVWHKALHGAEDAIVVVRSAFAVIERASDRIMRSIRTSRKNAGPVPETPITTPEPPKPVAEMTEAERLHQLKQREQELIVEIAQDPKDVSKYRELSDIYVKLENITDAVEALKAAAKLEPENKHITERLERLSERLERQKKKEEEVLVHQEEEQETKTDA